MISSLSWWEAHRSRLINEAINRPVLTMDIRSTAYVMPLAKGLKVTFEIKNLGKTPASIQSVKSEQLFLGEVQCEPASSIVKSFETLVGKEALPNIAIELDQDFLFNSDCTEKQIPFFAEVSILYTDTASKIPYTQDFTRFVSVPFPTPSASP